MSTRANVVIEYEDRFTGQPKQHWLYHHQDGNVQGVGEEIAQVIHDCQAYVDGVARLNFLIRGFPRAFEAVSGLQADIEFLYRITYADNGVSVVIRHGGYVDGNVERHYSREQDAPGNSVELYSAKLEGDLMRHVASFDHDIREPESYVRTLMPASQSVARAWRGRFENARRTTALSACCGASKRNEGGEAVRKGDGQQWVSEEQVREVQLEMDVSGMIVELVREAIAGELDDVPNGDVQGICEALGKMIIGKVRAA